MQRAHELRLRGTREQHGTDRHGGECDDAQSAERAAGHGLLEHDRPGRDLDGVRQRPASRRRQAVTATRYAGASAELLTNARAIHQPAATTVTPAAASNQK